jgi:sarcosine oxidase delta subunit
MLFCPYCLGKKEPSDHIAEDRLDDFGNVGGFHHFDNPNKKTLEFKLHLHGCKRVFLIVTDSTTDECVGCFKLPDEHWTDTMSKWERAQSDEE